MKKIQLLYIIFAGIMLASCGSDKNLKNPVDDMVRDMPTDRVFSIILNDMDVQGSFFTHYYHQYKIIEEKEKGKPEERITKFVEVKESYFKMHANDMGMEIVSRGEDGKLSKSTSPPGYNNYVGNERYGRWTQRNGTSFWEFYGQYAFMSSMFRMATYPVTMSYYTDWRSNYYGTGRSYYGPTTGGRSYYGTGSAYTRSSSPNSSWSNNTSRFKQRVQNRTSRSSSRYSGSSSRSRGGGFGK